MDWIKANIGSVWLDRDNAHYEVSITKFMQVKLVCENAANMKIRAKEHNSSLFN